MRQLFYEELGNAKVNDIFKTQRITITGYIDKEYKELVVSAIEIQPEYKTVLITATDKTNYLLDLNEMFAQLVKYNH